jgi:hypothetical protein
MTLIQITTNTLMSSGKLLTGVQDITAKPEETDIKI